MVALTVRHDIRNSSNEQEIFMYDISNGSVNKLSGELSTAFVKVAEENSSTENLENASLYEGEIMEEKKKVYVVVMYLL
uniref:Uncharacterized protein n=1 Tax=Megaselia scalaris TaxID=36166 RepID=T1GIX1_MEGSC